MFECIAENEAGRASIRMNAVVYGMYTLPDVIRLCFHKSYLIISHHRINLQINRLSFQLEMT